MKRRGKKGRNGGFTVQFSITYSVSLSNAGSTNGLYLSSLSFYFCLFNAYTSREFYVPSLLFTALLGVMVRDQRKKQLYECFGQEAQCILKQDLPYLFSSLYLFCYPCIAFVREILVEELVARRSTCIIHGWSESRQNNSSKMYIHLLEERFNFT